MRRLFRPLLILLALDFLFEAWLWSHLAPVVAWVVAHIPLRVMKARLRALIDRLPPAATLVVFIVPVLLLLPLKFLGLWMLAHGSWLGAMATLAVAKVVSMGVTAFIFDVTRPKLLQLAWFRWLYEHIIVWLEKAHALVDPIKAEVKAWLRPLRRRVRALVWLLRPKRAGRFLRRAQWLRRRAQRAQAA